MGDGDSSAEGKGNVSDQDHSKVQELQEDEGEAHIALTALRCYRSGESYTGW